MLPAPRDPRAPEAVPPDPPPEPPPLEPLLTELLRSAGAQAVHAVDRERAEILAEAGLADGDDVSALVQLARAAAVLGRGRGEWVEDVVVTLGRTVHVLRECDGVVLHARLDPSRGDVGAVRRGLGADGVRRAAAAAGRAAAPDSARRDTAARPATTRSGDVRDGAARSGGGRHAAVPSPAAGTGPEPAGGRPRPARGDTLPPRVAERPRPRPAAAPPARRAPAAPASGGGGWPYSLPDPANRRPAGPADRGDRQRPPGRVGPAHAALSTAPAMSPAPQPVAPHPLAGPPAPRRPQPVRPVSQPVSQPVPLQVSQPPMPVPVPRSAPQPMSPQPMSPQPMSQQPVSKPVPLQVSQPLPRPVPQPRSERPAPPPVPLPRPPARPGPDGREPALVTVDVGPPVTATGALAVLALPPVGALPRRRRAAAAPPAPSPRALRTPAVLRQPWAADLDTMGRVLALLHRMSERPAGNRLAPGH